MKIRTSFVIIVLVVSIAGIVSGEGNEKMKAEISLPSDVEGWKWAENQMEYNSKTLFAYIDGAAELYLAYGFQNLTVRRFEKSKFLEGLPS